MEFFDGYSNLWIDAWAARKKSDENIILSKYAAKWKNSGCAGSYCPVSIDPGRNEPEFRQITDHVSLIRRTVKEAEETVSAVVDGETVYANAEKGIHSLVLGVNDVSFAIYDMSQIDYLYDIGFRVMSLTGPGENPLASGYRGRVHAGLTDEGKRIVRYLRKKGVLIDLSNLNERSFVETANLTEGPLFVSHGNCYKFCANERNYFNSQLKAIRDSGGLFCVSAAGELLSDNPDERDLQSFCDHIVYASELIGVEHVGIGCNFMDFLNDYNGNEYLDYAKGFRNENNLPDLWDELKLRGAKDGDIEKICFGNFVRIIGKH